MHRCAASCTGASCIEVRAPGPVASSLRLGLLVCCHRGLRLVGPGHRHPPVPAHTRLAFHVTHRRTGRAAMLQVLACHAILQWAALRKQRTDKAGMSAMAHTHHRHTQPNRLREQEQVEVAEHSVQPNMSHIWRETRQ